MHSALSNNVPLEQRILGRTGLNVSAIAFGAGPISTLMVGEESERQRRVLRHAIERGVNWIDTAATYGGGKSEESLGRFFAAEPELAGRVQVATKVRLTADDLSDVRGAVRRSLEGSLRRLGLERVALLQLHNSITRERGDEPTSVTPADVLKTGGVADAIDELRREGLIAHAGLTGIGRPESLAEVVRSGRFETIQTPYHLLNPSAGCDAPADFAETDFGNIIAACAAMRMGIFVIRVLAGGALADNAPSPHTLKTPFFPLDLYERDRRRAAELRKRLAPGASLPQAAIRFAIEHPQVHAAIIGLGSVEQVDKAIQALQTASISPATSRLA
jgi:aryl-alcohol dehydrogenase-like predicted oxidoreductase